LVLVAGVDVRVVVDLDQVATLADPLQVDAVQATESDRGSSVNSTESCLAR
jgi:hypothetical protein